MVQYNILADIYTDQEHAWHMFLGPHSEFEVRGPKIVAELKESNADIICLTEVDHFEDFYRQHLTALGYEMH